jgi:hypothetical protein
MKILGSYQLNLPESQPGAMESVDMGCRGTSLRVGIRSLSGSSYGIRRYTVDIQLDSGPEHYIRTY